METFRISVLVSGNGSNLQCIIDAVEDGRIANSKIVGVISSSENAYALERARQHEIPAAAVTKYEYADMRDRMDAILKILDGEHPDLIVLAGYLSILPAKVVEKYRGRIINIHPALLPKFGGKDFYGIHVHEAVLAAGEKESGAKTNVSATYTAAISAPCTISSRCLLTLVCPIRVSSLSLPGSPPCQSVISEVSLFLSILSRSLLINTPLTALLP